MKKTLIPKLIFGYVLFVALGFIILCTFTQHAITHYAENREAQQLYRESVQIASGYADNYNKYSFSLQDFQKQMQSLGEYLSAQIWIMDNQGNILFDSTDESVGKGHAFHESLYESCDAKMQQMPIIKRSKVSTLPTLATVII